MIGALAEKAKALGSNHPVCQGVGRARLFAVEQFDRIEVLTAQVNTRSLDGWRGRAARQALGALGPQIGISVAESLDRLVRARTRPGSSSDRGQANAVRSSE